MRARGRVREPDVGDAAEGADRLVGAARERRDLDDGGVSREPRDGPGRRWREQVVRTLQGNPYLPETQQRARRLLDGMQASYEAVLADPNSLMRPWALDPQLRDRIAQSPRVAEETHERTE